MQLTYRLLTEADYPALADWLAADTWPYHGNPNPARETILAACHAGAYQGDEVRSYWIERQGQRVGLIRLFEIRDPIPRFDLRIASTHRGRGFGTEALRWLTDQLFQDEAVIRVEGQTRQDNSAMRRTFLRAGYVKEAHLRQAWPGPDGRLFDAIGYGITRSDWASGEVTPVDWSENP